MMRTITATVTAVLVSALLISCGGESNEGQPTSEAEIQLVGAGATFPEPLYQRWIDRFREAHPEIAFSYYGVGSSEGIRRFIAEEVDFGGSDAAMKDAEIARVRRGVKLIPVTAGMIVLAYNLPGIDGELRLPRDVYVDIFLGKIQRWDDPRIVAANPDVELPSRLIQTVVRRDGSGTTYAFTSHLSTISADWRDHGPGSGKLIDWPGGAMTGNGNAGVAQKVKISQGSIGYMEYGFSRRLGLPMAVLENRAGNFVKPDAGSGQSALALAASPDSNGELKLFLPDPDGDGAYPMVTLSWIMLYDVYADPNKAAALRQAMSWGLTEGQPIAEEMGYIPLPQAIVAAATQVAESIR